LTTPLVSIIIPVFNRENLVAETLDSIIFQTYQNWECILVDDGSTDQSEDVICRYTQKDNRIRLYSRPETLPKGANTCRNYGYQKAKGKFVLWFDSDDVMLENLIEHHLELFDTKIQLTICGYYNVNSNLEDRKPIIMNPQNSLLKDFLTGRIPMITGSVLFRKSFIENNNQPFDPILRRGQEADFFMQNFKNVKSDEFRVDETPLFLYRFHAGSKTGKAQKYISEYAQSRLIVFSKLYKTAKSMKDANLQKYAYWAVMLTLVKSVRDRDSSIYKTFKEYFLRNNPDFNQRMKQEFSFFYRCMFFTKKTPKFIEKRWLDFVPGDRKI